MRKGPVALALLALLLPIEANASSFGRCAQDGDLELIATRHPGSLVDIGALTVESDFTGFMHKDVPEEVRRAALRRLWVLMQLPVSCDELCYEPEAPASGFERLASEKNAVATQ